MEFLPEWSGVYVSLVLRDGFFGPNNIRENWHLVLTGDLPCTKWPQRQCLFSPDQLVLPIKIPLDTAGHNFSNWKSDMTGYITGKQQLLNFRFSSLCMV